MVERNQDNSHIVNNIDLGASAVPWKAIKAGMPSLWTTCKRIRRNNLVILHGS